MIVPVVLSALFAATLAAAQPATQPTQPTQPTPQPATNAETKSAVPAGSPRTSRAAVSTLVKAAADPDSRYLEALVRSGAPVNGRMPNSETPLQAAAAAGRVANVSTLLAHGARINALAARGTTALGWAARNGHEATVRTLLDAGAKPDAAADLPHAPMPLAVKGGHKSIVSLLTERGSKAFERPRLAGAVLIALGEANSVEMTAELVPRMAGLVAGSPAMREAAADAVLDSNAPIAQAILRNLGAASKTRDFQTALLFAAARRGRPDLTSAAIAAGADVNARHAKHGTPLSAAVASEDASTVGLLLAAGVDLQAAGVDKARLEAIVGKLGPAGQSANRSGPIAAGDVHQAGDETPLFRAAQRGDFLGVKTLLDEHADTTATVQRWPGDRGWTALMIAAAGGQTAIVELLLNAGAPANQRNGAGRTALSFAAFYGRSQAVALLLGAGADPDAADILGQNPLMLAEAGGDPATIQILRNLRRDAAPATGPDAATVPR